MKHHLFFHAGFHPLADILNDDDHSASMPNRTAVMVLDKGDGLVAKPVNFR